MTLELSDDDAFRINADLEAFGYIEEDDGKAILRDHATLLARVRELEAAMKDAAQQKALAENRELFERLER